MCSNTFSVTGAEIPVTISVGVASARATGEPASPELLLKAADDALYLAKRQGRNQAVLASGPRAVGSGVR